MTTPTRADDARFLLPTPVPDPVRGPRRVAAAAADASTTGVLIEGGGRIDGNWCWTDVVVRAGTSGPRLIVPARRPTVARYVFDDWVTATDAWRRRRNHAVAVAVGRGLVPPGARLSVGSRSPGPPYLVAAAEAFGIPSEPDWFASFGDGDVFQRGVFHVFRAGAPRPEWIVKFARTPGDDEPFLAESRAADLLTGRAPVAARRAPRVLGRSDVDVPASVESAAPGPGLNAVLDRPGDRAEKLRLIDETVGWILELGDESRGRPDEVAPERRRLEDDVLPAWPDAPRNLVTRLPETLAPVLAHHDAGSWNMVATPAGVMVLDWESARYPALPLWDLLYFLTDALVALDGPAPDTDKVDRALRLLRGEHPESSLLFEYLFAGAARAGVDHDAIGPLVTLSWLHHGTSPERRRERARRNAGAAAEHRVEIGLLTRLATPWLNDPALGPDWPALPH